MRILTVCGSLQARSSNAAALTVVEGRLGESGVAVVRFDGLRDIEPFDPDRQESPEFGTIGWRAALTASDAVVIAAPEYAGGLAGTVKNALDWIVGSAELYRKPVAIIAAGTSGGEHARRQLAQTLTWQGAHVVAELGIAAPRTKSAAGGNYTDPVTLAALADLADRLVAAVRAPETERVAIATEVVAGFGIEPGHVAPAG